jgi:ABC-type polysaccharide/polyol phosphate export permease
MTGLIENFRRAIIPGPLPDPQTFLISTAITGVALPLAYGFFKYIDATVADVI